eukprot:tig00001264_g7865.t1
MPLGSGLARSLRDAFAAEGLYVHAEWVEAILRAWSEKHGAHSVESWSKDELLRRLQEDFMFADLNLAGSGCLPPNVSGMHKQVLQGSYVLQVDEMINVAEPEDSRYDGESSSRMLKLRMTDGRQSVSGSEFRRISGLAYDSPAGLKVVVTDAWVRRGLLDLGPECVRVLGGRVEHLERQRLFRWEQMRKAFRRRPHPDEPPEPEPDFFAPPGAHAPAPPPPRPAPGPQPRPRRPRPGPAAAPLWPRSPCCTLRRPSRAPAGVLLCPCPWPLPPGRRPSPSPASLPRPSPPAPAPLQPQPHASAGFEPQPPPREAGGEAEARTGPAPAAPAAPAPLVGQRRAAPPGAEASGGPPPDSGPPGSGPSEGSPPGTAPLGTPPLATGPDPLGTGPLAGGEAGRGGGAEGGRRAAVPPTEVIDLEEDETPSAPQPRRRRRRRTGRGRGRGQGGLGGRGGGAGAGGGGRGAVCAAARPRGRRPGALLRVKACVYTVEKARCKARDLIFYVTVEDGSCGATVLVSQAVVEELMGISALGFRTLVASRGNRSAAVDAQQRLNRLLQTLRLMPDVAMVVRAGGGEGAAPHELLALDPAYRASPADLHRLAPPRRP